MKRHNYLIASLVILIGMGAMTVSCKKEQTVKYRKAQIISCETAKDGGGDDEDPIIQGKVKKHNLTVVDSALVETITASTNVKVGEVYTDSFGGFEQKVSAGIYYFRVTVPGVSTPYVTDTLHVTTDRDVLILVD